MEHNTETAASAPQSPSTLWLQPVPCQVGPRRQEELRAICSSAALQKQPVHKQALITPKL